MISKKLAILVLNECLATGADFAEIFIEDTNVENISLDNGNCETSTDSIIYGAGIRLLNKLQSVYGYTNDLSKNGLLKLAKTLASSFNEERKVTVTKITKVKNKYHHQPKIDYSTISKEDKIKYLLKGSDACKNYDERIVRVMAGFLNRQQKVYIFNSDGRYVEDTRTRGRAFISAIASNGDAIESAFEGPGASKGFEFFNQEIDFEKLGKETAESAITMLNAKECPSGKMPVIIDNGFGGVIFHEACGHALEASSVSKNQSVFCNKLGQKVASDKVTAIDDGTIPNAWGSQNVDDEGNPQQKRVLIENGILKSYMIDRLNGRRMGLESTSSSRRQSYKFETTSRMTNTYIAAGNDDFDEMFEGIKRGLYAKKMGGGSVNPQTGEFNFAVLEGYLIEDGKISYPVKGASLIGNGADILFNIDRVGKNLERGQGMCGSSSGSIPTDVGQPAIRVSQITVGGTANE